MYTLEPAEFYSGVVIGSTSKEVCSFFSPHFRDSTSRCLSSCILL